MSARDPRPRAWLVRQWVEVIGRAGAVAEPGAVDAAGRELVDRYGEPQRHYHTAEHVAEVLQVVRSLSNPDDPGVTFRLDRLDDYLAVTLAAWFHDAVYDPRSTTNEDDSAELATVVLGGLGLGAELLAEVDRLVRLTATHDVATGDDNGMVMIDADLAILGARPARYDRYAADVRAEYAHVDDDAFRAGRALVLERFLALGSIYHCEQMVVRCDENARRNLRRELDQLGDPPR